MEAVVSWQNFMIVSSFLLAIFGIPSSYYAFRMMWKDLFSPQESVDQFIAELKSASSPLQANDRVVLTFDKERASTPGTFENVAYKAAEAYPLQKDRHLIILYPEGVLRGNATMLPMLHFVGLSMFGTFAILWFLIIILQPPFSIFYILYFMGMSVVLLSVGYLTLRHARKLKRGQDIASAYLNYLKHREISVGREFTQSRNAFERERTSAQV